MGLGQNIAIAYFGVLDGYAYESDIEMMVDKLDEYLASVYVLRNKVEHFRWNCTGVTFFKFYSELKSMYKQLDADHEKVSQRISMLGESPLQGISDYKSISVIPENSVEGIESISMAQALKIDYKQLANKLREVISIAYDINDQVTADDAVSWLRPKEEWAWKLTKYLQEFKQTEDAKYEQQNRENIYGREEGIVGGTAIAARTL